MNRILVGAFVGAAFGAGWVIGYETHAAKSPTASPAASASATSSSSAPLPSAPPPAPSAPPPASAVTNDENLHAEAVRAAKAALGGPPPPPPTRPWIDSGVLVLAKVKTPEAATLLAEALRARLRYTGATGWPMRVSTMHVYKDLHVVSITAILKDEAASICAWIERPTDEIASWFNDKSHGCWFSEKYLLTTKTVYVDPRDANTRDASADGGVP